MLQNFQTSPKNASWACIWLTYDTGERAYADLEEIWKKQKSKSVPALLSIGNIYCGSEGASKLANYNYWSILGQSWILQGFNAQNFLFEIWIDLSPIEDTKEGKSSSPDNLDQIPACFHRHI